MDHRPSEIVDNEISIAGHIKGDVIRDSPKDNHVIRFTLSSEGYAPGGQEGEVVEVTKEVTIEIHNPQLIKECSKDLEPGVLLRISGTMCLRDFYLYGKSWEEEYEGGLRFAYTKPYIVAKAIVREKPPEPAL